MFVTGLIRRRTSDTKISLKRKLHNKLKRMVQILPNAEGNQPTCSKRTAQKRNTNQNKLIFMHISK
jgi:hypothetical protein